MKRISSLFFSSLLALMPILSGCAGKEQKLEKQTGNQATSVEKISDNILDEMEDHLKMVIRLKDM